jgi:hypothetical protein
LVGLGVSETLVDVPVQGAVAVQTAASKKALPLVLCCSS